MKKEELLDLISIKQAAQLRGVTIEAISDLIRRGRLHTIEIAGKRFLRRSEVTNFKPQKGGRPSTRKASKKSPTKKG
jgi:hypothetical protein